MSEPSPSKKRALGAEQTTTADAAAEPVLELNTDILTEILSATFYYTSDMLAFTKLAYLTHKNPGLAAFACKLESALTVVIEIKDINAKDQNPFIIPTENCTVFNVTVDWGDGTTDTERPLDEFGLFSADLCHRYEIPGTYIVRVIPNDPGQTCLDALGCDYFTEGTTSWTTVGKKYITLGKLGITDLSGCFSNPADGFNPPEISNWNVAGVTDMSFMFRAAYDFNQPLNRWDMSSVKETYHMFESATNFNQDLSAWDTSRCRNMAFMFKDASHFNGNVSNWNVSNAAVMACAYGCQRLTEQRLLL